MLAAASPAAAAAEPATTTGANGIAAAETGLSAEETGLSAEEIAGLLWMREEEKLAHDVYVALYERWGMAIFERIAESEVRHMAAVKSLLDLYGIDDPAAGKAVGEFSDPTIAELYAKLVKKGSRSRNRALRVGAYIEELDILDLRSQITDEAPILRVYENLERGSENHLRAFVRKLERRGVEYEPVLMDQDDFEAIIDDGRRRRGR
jgi:hypothetical protein